MQFLKQSTAATTVVGPILDSTGAEYTGAVIGDLTITKNGTSAAMASAATLTHIANGHYTLVFTTGNTDTAGRLDIHCNKSTYQMPPKSFQVCVATVFDILVTNAATAAGGWCDIQRMAGTALTGRDIGASVLLSSGTGTGQLNFTSGVVQADAAKIGGQTASASGTITFPNATLASTTNITGGTITTVTTLTNLPAITTDWITAAGVSAAAVTKIQNGLATPTNITAGTITTVTNLTNLPAITTDWITAAGVSAGAVTKIQSGLSTYAGGDTSGTTTLLSRLTSTRAGNLDYLTGDAYAIVSSGSIGNAVIVGYIDTEVGAIYSRLGAPAGASMSADIAAVKAVDDAIKAKTDNLPAAPAATGDIPSAATIATAVWNVATSGLTTAGSIGKRLVDLFTGITSVASWLGALAGKTADSATQTEIRATTAGASYTITTDSLEAIKDALPDTAGLADDVAEAVVEALGDSEINFVSPLSQDGTTLLIVTGDSYTVANGRSLTFSITNQPDLVGATPYLKMDGVVLAEADAIASGTQSIVFDDITAATTSTLQPGKNKPYQVRFTNGSDVATPINGLAEIKKGL